MNFSRDELTIKFISFKDSDRIKIFGSKFVENNKDNLKIFIKDLSYELKEEFDIKICYVKNYQIKLTIKLIGVSKIKDASYMFHECSSLIKIKGISNLDLNNITNISHMFDNCRSLISLSEISKWDTKNIIDMSYLFSDCQSLEKIPDISKWNIKNVKNISYLFYNCFSLSYLPDISQWDTENISNLSYCFFNCIKLKNYLIYHLGKQIIFKKWNAYLLEYIKCKKS